MKQIALLEYAFMFDPSKTWSSLSEFESLLVQFFQERDLDVEVVKGISGQNGRRMLLLSPIEKPGVSEKVSIPKNGEVQKKLNELKGQYGTKRTTR